MMLGDCTFGDCYVIGPFEDNRGDYAIILSTGVDGNVADVYGETPEQAMESAQVIVNCLNGREVGRSAILDELAYAIGVLLQPGCTTSLLSQSGEAISVTVVKDVIKHLTMARGILAGSEQVDERDNDDTATEKMGPA